MGKKKSNSLSIGALMRTPMKPKVKDRVMLAAHISGVLALLGVLALYIGGATKPPPEPFTGQYITLYERVNDFAEDYTTLWLAGTADNEDTLASMTADYVDTGLPDNGYTVNKIRTYVVNDGETEPVQGQDGVYLFPVEVRAQVVAPGGRGVEWLTYRLTVTGYHDTFKAAATPAPANTTRVPHTLKTAYENTAKVDSPLGSSVSNFADAYMTPANASGSLASTVTSDFSDSPVSSSLWQQAELTDMHFYADSASVTPDAASEGDTLHVLATIRAVTSNATWSIVQLPLTVQMQSNGQWSVSAIDEVIQVGGVDTNNTGESAPSTTQGE
ncbi:hypothetical protein [Corynebacterium sp. AOP12-C2-36]|uniref:hypothetical protein n=1 Tax=Corynebacterium sp. AOP12-C2-36 TaxID=3457723 RepID=UPI0040344A02